MEVIEPVSVANSYKYLGLKSTTKVCLNRISEDTVPRAKQGTVEFFKVLWNTGYFDINVFLSFCSGMYKMCEVFAKINETIQ